MHSQTATGQGVIIRQGTAAGKGGEHRQPQRFGQSAQLCKGTRHDCAPAGDDDGSLGPAQFVRGGAQELMISALAQRRPGRQIGRKIDFLHLNLDRQVNQHRARLAGTGQNKGVAHNLRQHVRSFHPDTPFGDGGE